MVKLFGLKEEIEKDEFIKRWEDSESKRDEAGKHDGSAHENLERHRQYQRLIYYRVTLTETGLNNLILPYHNHPDNKVNQGGEPFWRIISKYSDWIEEGLYDACIQQLCWLMFNKMKFNESEGLVEAGFMFVSHDKELAMSGYYQNHGENKLYVGSFHQFVTYGLWIKQNGHKPIKIYYCKRS